MILDKIKEKAIEYAKGLSIADFAFALPYSYVIVSGRDKDKYAMGVSMTLSEEVQKYQNSIKEISLLNFISKIDSVNIIERTLALSAINAVSQYYIDTSEGEQIDVKEIIRKQSGKIAIIGNMPPITEATKEISHGEVYVFERNPKLWSKGVLSDTLEYNLLPEMNFVFATAASLVNETVDLIVERARSAKSIFLIGATGQILPEFIKNTGITHIASMKITTINKAVQALKLGDYKELVKSSQKYIFQIL